ncbi:hypothetical protein OS493_033467 [Desmophyllum pertusum]|uniref:L-dopachrome isomerase n=1 Tax=Desmophyllum pertusum TaxID=174260 RepID=A0A9X0D787_9CNID|nr:hypothetical protein OS493_033467 [Desmophyllum pertusum]
MPYFDLTTNVTEVPTDFHKETTDLLAKHLGKPSSVVGVHVNAGAKLTFGGTDDRPAGIINLYSAGCLGPEKNNSFSAAITEQLQKQLKIPSDRF